MGFNPVKIIKNAGDKIGSTVKSAGDSAADAVRSGVNSVSDVADNAIDFVSDGVTDALESTGDFLQESFDGLEDMLSEAYRGFEDLATDLSDALSQGLTFVGEGFAQLVDSTFNAISSYTSQFLQWVEGGVANLGLFIENALLQTIGVAYQLFTGVAETLFGGVNDLLGSPTMMLLVVGVVGVAGLAVFLRNGKAHEVIVSDEDTSALKAPQVNNYLQDRSNQAHDKVKLDFETV